jgi:hypothetical protein
VAGDEQSDPCWKLTQLVERVMLDVDPGGSALSGSAQDREALGLGALPQPALALWAAGGQDRGRGGCDQALDLWLGEGVEAQLHELEGREPAEAGEGVVEGGLEDGRADREWINQSGSE